MKIAYVATSFCAPSHTFIRREISELRSLETDICLFGIRPIDAKSISCNEKNMSCETTYLYPLKLGSVVFANIWFVLYKPANYWKALLRALFNEETNILKHFKLVYHFFVSPYVAFLMLNSKIDHIHAHFTNVASTIAMYASELTGITYSITLHSAGTYGLYSVAGLREKINRAKFLCAVSNYTIDYYDSIFKCKNKTFLTRCGLNLEAYRRSSEKSFLKNGKMHIVAVGRLEEKKGFIYLIEACKYLRDNEVEFETVIIGEGPLKKTLYKKVENYGLKDVVFFKGCCSEEIVKMELEKSDMCVIPSVEAKTGEKEGIPVVIMEAMALGVPVVATRHAGIPEIVKDRQTGVLVPEKNSLAIYDAIKALINDDNLRKRCIENGKRIISDEFNVIKIAKFKKEIFVDNI